MYVLGVNGIGERSHDASACLFKDNKLVAFAEEERFTRKKHAYDSAPHNAIKFCLEEAKISEKDIDTVAFGWDYKKLFSLAGRDTIGKRELITKIFPRKYFQKINPRIVLIEHHLAHASSAYRCSGFKDAAILVVDGQGEDISTSIWSGKNGKIDLVKKFPIKDSIGYYYDAATKFLGFGHNCPGKTMGLSSYGDSDYDFSSEIIKKDKDYSFDINLGNSCSLDYQEEIVKRWISKFEKRQKEQKVKYSFDKQNGLQKEELIFSQLNKNFASSVQKSVDELMVHLSRSAIDLAGSKNLCIAGGVGLNCVANGKVLESGICENIFVHPISNDAGVSMGAAMEALSQMSENPDFKMESVYLGPDFGENEILCALENKSLTNFKKLENPAKSAAKFISEGKIVGWFQGRMEAGPRALGNRSILADPTSSHMKDLVNNVKGRELWRPLCPSILEEYKDEYIDSSVDSPFMILNFKINGERKKEISSVVHIDGTARVQTVSKRTNPLFWEVIKEFQNIKGVPVLLNTSFNLRGEPIVCGPNDALRTFFSSKMDILIMGDYLVEK